MAELELYISLWTLDVSVLIKHKQIYKDSCAESLAWSSSGELSTVLCMILFIRTVTMSLQLERGGKVQWRNNGKYMIK